MDLFDIRALNRVVDELVPTYGYLTRTYFPNVVVSDEETITFDVRKRGQRISPFVHPRVESQIVEKTGYRAVTYKPAYVKDKRVFDPTAPLKRNAGEKIGGSLSRAERLDALIAQESADQVDMLNRRLEVMAGEILATGAVTIEGEKYPRVVVDYDRDAALTVAHSGPDQWGESGFDPLADLDAWSELMYAKSGRRNRRWVMTLDAWSLFKSATSVVKHLDRMRDTNTVGLEDTITSDDDTDGYLAGTIGGHTIILYSNDYVDPLDNTVKPILPAYSVIAATSAAEGTQSFGAIKDLKAGLQARRYFQKSWEEEDPSVRYLLMQSAPLLYPVVPDATFAAVVKETSE